MTRDNNWTLPNMGQNNAKENAENNKQIKIEKHHLVAPNQMAAMRYLL